MEVFKKLNELTPKVFSRKIFKFVKFIHIVINFDYGEVEIHIRKRENNSRRNSNKLKHDIHVGNLYRMRRVFRYLHSTIRKLSQRYRIVWISGNLG